MTAKTLITFAGAISAAMIGTGPAHADPPKFPDLSGYAPVNVHDYEISYTTPGHVPIPMVYFVTPDGITCNFISESAGCTGNNFPGVPPASPSSGGGARVNSIATNTPLQPTSDPIASDNSPQFKTLPPFHSITVDGVVCGVDDAKTTACKDPQGRGFVLSPRGSGWLPHV
ncbi:hypothetical protein E2F47_21450 [Mycobacterium eburneum]|nr:hypothetical protein E2F47_21450 [Mycobacterium eburneum]